MRWLYILACTLLAISSLNLEVPSWYSGYVRFSDWRGTPTVDWATNVPVAKYYGGGDPKSLRGEVEISAGDILGIDYYAYMIPPTVGGRPLLPVEFYEMFRDTIANGGVIILEAR